MKIVKTKKLNGKPNVIGSNIKKYRFDSHTIDMLMRFDYSSLEPKDIKDDIEKLYLNIKEFCKTDFYHERSKEDGDNGNA